MYGVQRDVSHEHVTSLLSNSVTEETIATDSSINRKHVESLLLNAMGKGDLWDIFETFRRFTRGKSTFLFLIKKKQ